MVCQTGISVTTDGFLDGWHCSWYACAAATRSRPRWRHPTVTEISTTDGRHVERAGFMRVLDVSKREDVRRWYSMSVSKPAAAPIATADDGHRRDQRRDTADVRPLFRLVLRLLRHHCLSHVACTSSSVHLVIRVAASPSFHPRRIYAPISFSMNRSIGHTTCVCIVNGRSGSSSSATRPATSAKHHKAYSGRFIGGKYIGIYSIQDTRCTK